MSQEAQASRMAVLLFTDIVDSVAMERRLGTEAYSRLLRLHHQLFHQVLQTVGAGKVYQDTGDGFLAEFATAADAVNAALLFQALLPESQWEYDPPRVRVGIHQGQLAEMRLDPNSPGKIVGMPVNIAARVMSLAGGGQILMTRPVFDDARQFVRQHPIGRRSGRSPPGLKWKSHGPYILKGADEPIDVFEVGAPGISPLTPPPDSDKAKRVAPAERAVPRPRSRAIGAALTALCGLILLTPLGDPWVNASYDYLFLFGARSVTNKVVLILMDNPAYDALKQEREKPWDRRLHSELLNKLTHDGCPLVVFDVFFDSELKAETDAALAEAMRRHGHVVLGTELFEPEYSNSGIVNAPLHPLFLEAADGRWGVGKTDAELGETACRHWPFPAPGLLPSLPWTSALAAGAQLSQTPQKEWLRYYRQDGGWENVSYHFALSNAPGFFHDKVVFIGSKPENKDPNFREKDKFRTPYTRWTGKAVGGVEIMATTFLNLKNGDWLRRAGWWVEMLLLVGTGVLVGGGLCQMRPLVACLLAAGMALALTLGAVMLSYFTNFWFPWLVIAGGQVPCALAWAMIPATARFKSQPARVEPKLAPQETIVIKAENLKLPDAPEYELFDPPFGEGGFGKVWLVRNAVGQWQALKAVYRAKFDNPGPYEAEFNGLQRYKPISERHPGLLRIDLVSRKKGEGYFYYVMELGDSQTDGWEQSPTTYKPKDLESVRKGAEKGRLPLAECLRIGIILAEALEFLHSQGLTHRDIKPSNVIFVNGRPKLADVGLVSDVRPTDMIKTWVGTAGYMPPPPERPGTVQADIYAFGMLLYVVSTGRDPSFFPEVSATLMEKTGEAGFMLLNPIILKACQPERGARYKSAAELLVALNNSQGALDKVVPTGHEW